MSTHVLSPQPRRPPKRERALAGVDVHLDSLPVSKHLEQALPPYPTQATFNIDSQSEYPNKRRRLHSPGFELSLDKALQDPRPYSTPPWPARPIGSKHCRPQLSTHSPIDAWIFAVSSTDLSPTSTPIARPSSCPATIDVGKEKRTIFSLSTIKQMAQHPSQYNMAPPPLVRSGTSTSQNGRPSTAHTLYRLTLSNNRIILDLSGRRMPEELSTFASTQILKRRGSPQLTDEAISKVMDKAERLADSTEGPTTRFLSSSMFPFDHPGIAEGGDSQWSTMALPNSPEYTYDVSIPKPDIHLGYPNNQHAGWSEVQSSVITHPVARPYTTPARGNAFPFLMVEMKSESAGGTLYVAENQAAGSGSHSVNALLWLLREAGTYDSSSLTDTIAFTIALSHREAIFYLHWYSETDRRFYMSFLKSYSSFSAEDIRGCNNAVKNIIDFGIGARKTAIGKALEALFPIPEHWKEACPPSATASSAATSNSGGMGKRKRGDVI